MKKIIIGLLVGLAILVLIQDFIAKKQRNTTAKTGPYVVMLSLDGFRWDYTNKTSTPNFDYIAKQGVKATGLQPCFPSKTFPNHYSIATGLYPGNHGLISNSFYASDLKKYYSIRDRDKVENGKFYKGEPIWVTAEAQRIKTASYFWVGSEAKIKGYRPSYYKLYDHNFPYGQRIDSVINWLSLPFKERPRLITWYLDKADGVGHDLGPDSDEMINTIGMLDSLIGVFMNKVNQLSIKDSLNFIIVSDHGMSKIDSNKIIYIKEFIQDHWVDTLIGANPFSLVYSTKEYTDSVYKNLNNVNGISVWKKDDLPERFHLKQNTRCSEIVVVADSGWTTALSTNKSYLGGTHGYDNMNKDMYGIFYGIGPLFKNNYNAKTLYNTDIYSLIIHMLGIKPAPNDGKPERIMHVLKD